MHEQRTTCQLNAKERATLRGYLAEARTLAASASELDERSSLWETIVEALERLAASLDETIVP